MKKKTFLFCPCLLSLPPSSSSPPPKPPRSFCHKNDHPQHFSVSFSPFSRHQYRARRRRRLLVIQERKQLGSVLLLCRFSSQLFPFCKVIKPTPEKTRVALLLTLSPPLSPLPGHEGGCLVAAVVVMAVGSQKSPRLSWSSFFSSLPYHFLSFSPLLEQTYFSFHFLSPRAC